MRKLKNDEREKKDQCEFYKQRYWSIDAQINNNKKELNELIKKREEVIKQLEEYNISISELEKNRFRAKKEVE